MVLSLVIFLQARSIVRMDYQLLFGKSLLVASLGLPSGISICQMRALLMLS